MKKVRLVLSLSLACTSCAASGYPIEPQNDDAYLREKYRGVEGVVLRVDAATPKNGVVIVSETGESVDMPSTLRLDKVDTIARGVRANSLPLPKTIHVTWRDGEYQFSRRSGWIGGRIVGDYTVPVASRIPDEVLDYIRQNGGALRLKIRLTDDGVLIGWDVEEWYSVQGRRGLRNVLPGGDFREAQIFNGKMVDPGWQK